MGAGPNRSKIIIYEWLFCFIAGVCYEFCDWGRSFENIDVGGRR